jgi:5-methylcytosine-specific restriction endonuclease McrA
MARVPKTRNGGTWTEARYRQQIRSFMRKAFRWWKPAQEKLEERKRRYAGPNKQQKWEYQCELCEGWFLRKNVEIDHIEPAGSFTAADLSDLPQWILRLTPESKDAYQVLCKNCHRSKTEQDRKK